MQEGTETGGVPARLSTTPLPAGIEPGDVVVPIDAHVSKLAAWKECQDNVTFWTKRLKQLQAELAEVLGDATVGTLGGQAVLYYRPKDQFQGDAFKKAYPDMHKFYTRPVTKDAFDLEWFKASQPHLYEQFQSRAWRNTFEA